MKTEIINETSLRIIPDSEAEKIILSNLPKRDYTISPDKTEGYKIEIKKDTPEEDIVRVTAYRKRQDELLRSEEELLKELKK